MTGATVVWAVPGEDSIIDTIDPTTGLTTLIGRDEAAVLRDYPTAERMTWEAWKAAKARRQQTPIRWLETDQASYDRLLNILPPACWIGDAFMVGEPDDHDIATGKPRFVAFWAKHGKYYTASRPMTVREFREELC